MVRMDKLLEAWRADPRAEATVELCAMLIRAALKAGSNRLLPETFVVAFANEAMRRHPDNVDVLVALADVNLASGLVPHAKTLLDLAAEQSADDARVKERLEKISRVRRTAELGSRSGDPETLDAPTTPMDPPTEKKRAAPPGPIMLPRSPRRQPTVHGLAPAPPGQRKPTVKGVASPLAPRVEDDEPPTVTEAVPAGAFAEPARKNALAADLAAAPPPPASAPARPRSDPPTGVSKADADGPPTRVDPEGPPTRVPTGERGEEGPVTKVGPDGPPTGAFAGARTLGGRSGPADADGPPTKAGADDGPSTRGPGGEERVSLVADSQPTGVRQPPPRPGAKRAAVRRPAPRPVADVPPLEDPHSEHEVPTKVTELPPLGPHGLSFEPRRGGTAASEPRPPGEREAPPEAPISDEGEWEAPTRARPLAPPAGSPLRGTARLPQSAAVDDSESATTAVRDQPDPLTMSNAVTNQWAPGSSAPPPAGVGPPGPPPVPPAPPTPPPAFPAPGGHFHVAPAVAGPVGVGGTLAMSVQGAPGSEDAYGADGVRTRVLSAAEALHAARIDPRPPPPQPERTAGGTIRQEPAGPPAPTFGPPPSMRAPPPEAPVPALAPPSLQAPTFGEPPAPSIGMVPFPGAAHEAPPVYPGPGFAAHASQDSFGQDPFAPGPPPLVPGPADVPRLPDAMPFPQFPDPMAFDASAPMPGVNALPMPDVPEGASTSGSHARPRSSSRLLIALVVAVISVLGLIGYAAYLLFGDARGTDTTPIASRPLPEDLERALLSGSPPDLVKADALLRAQEANAPPEIRLARVRERALYALEVSGTPTGIDGALQAARSAGVPDADLAFAELIEALLKGDGARADQLVTTYASDRQNDAHFALARGVLLERRGDLAAKDQYVAAMSIEPKMRPAAVRLARWHLLHSEIDQARATFADWPSGDPSRTVLEAFVWVRSTLAAGKPAGTAPDPIVSTPEISRALHPVFPAVRLLADADQVAAKRRQTGKINPEGQAQLKLAIDESDGPALALLFGEVGLARGDEQGAIAAANRALDLAPGYPGALTVLARASVGLGKLDQLDAVVDKLPADQTRGLKAFSAYEQGKLADLTKLAQGLTDATDPGGLVRVRLQRLRGNAPIPDAALERLMKADAVGGDLCAVDAWLDAGDLARARAVVETWPDAATHPLRASRLARLLRYEGKDREASSALGAAAPGRAVLVERIILAADSASGAEQALSLVDERLGPERPFWQAFAHAKKGEGDKAASFLDAAQPPSFDAQLSLRIAAALAYAEAKDARGEPVVRVLLEGFPKNPDVQRAARALDIQPERR